MSTDSNVPRRTGTVKRFRAGWGFLGPEDGGREVFCHYSQVQSSGFKTLVVGERVEFDTETKDGRTQAVRIVRLGASDDSPYKAAS